VEHEVVPGVTESLKVMTRTGTQRIAEYAFEHAYLNNRSKVTAVHKANIMKKADGIFLESCQAVAKKYPQIEYEGADKYPPPRARARARRAAVTHTNTHHHHPTTTHRCHPPLPPPYTRSHRTVSLCRFLHFLPGLSFRRSQSPSHLAFLLLQR
jgi:hypothetical protein